MKKALWLLLLTGACQSEGPTPYWAGCKNPATETLLKNNIRTIVGLESSLVYAYHYKGQVVFLVAQDPNFVSDAMAFVYDCEGKRICEFGGIAGVNTCPDFSTTATDRAVVWKN